MTLKTDKEIGLHSMLLLPLQGNFMFYRVYYKVGIGGKINEAKAQLKKDIDNMQRNFKEPKHKKRKKERLEMLEVMQKDLEKQILELEENKSVKDEKSQKKTRTFGSPKPKAQSLPHFALQSKHFTTKSEALRFMKQHYEFCQIMFVYQHTDSKGWKMIFDKYTPKDF